MDAGQAKWAAKPGIPRKGPSELLDIPRGLQNGASFRDDGDP